MKLHVAFVVFDKEKKKKKNKKKYKRRTTMKNIKKLAILLASILTFKNTNEE